MTKLNLKGIKNIVLIIHDEEDYDNRLSSLSFPNSTSIFRFYGSILFQKYNLMKIINAINTSLNNNPLIEPPSSTIMFSISSLKKFYCYFFINAWSYMS